MNVVMTPKQRYFQERIDARSKEINRLQMRIFTILDQVRGHHNPAAEQELAKLRKEITRLQNERLRYSSIIPR